MNAAVDRALAAGEYVVMSRAGEPGVRTADAAEADRFAASIGGTVLAPAGVAA